MEHLLLNSCSNIVQFIRKQSILKKIFFSVSFHLFIKCLLPVFSLSIVCTMKQGRGGCLPPIGLSIYFFVSSKTQEERSKGADRMQDGRMISTGCKMDRSTGAPEDRSRSREHRSRSKTPKSCSEPDHFRPPPLEKKVVSGPGRQAQNRYITPTLRVSDFYLYLHHVQRFNS